MREMLRDIAPLLGVLLPAIAAYFMYQRTERDRDKKLQDDAKTGFFAGVGGAVASTQNVKLYVEEFQRVTQAIDRLTEAQTLSARTHKEGSERWASVLDEMELLRRAIEELVSIIKRREQNR